MSFITSISPNPLCSSVSTFPRTALLLTDPWSPVAGR